MPSQPKPPLDPRSRPRCVADVSPWQSQPQIIATAASLLRGQLPSTPLPPGGPSTLRLKAWSTLRSLRSADDALTLVVQAQIAPFANRKMHEMHLHELSWPTEVLAGLGNASVRLRVTLSYFVEPNPGRRGWKKRHRYASHGLRFEVRKPTETTDEFRKRLNQRALDEDEEKPGIGGDSSDWYLGEKARNKGSLHSDLWVGTAADLAERGVIGVYPVGGWWKEQPKRDRSADGARYALVVSIETTATNVDLWTPVATEIGVPAEVVEIEGWE